MKFRNNLFLILVLFSTAFFQCKKKKSETIISGVAFSSVEGTLLVNTTVKFYRKTLSGSSFSNTFKFVNSVETDNQGMYEFSFDKTSSDVEFKIEANKDNYSEIVLLINPESITTGVVNEKNLDLAPVGRLKFNIKSTSNTSSTDEVLFNYNNKLKGGTSFSNLLFVGSSTDTILNTLVVAEKHSKFSYVLKRNGQFLSVTDSVFVSKGDEVIQEISY